MSGANTSFERQSPSGKGSIAFTFGESREKYEKVFIKNKPVLGDPEVPGPGFYPLTSFIDKIVKRANSRQRTSSCLTTQELNKADPKRLKMTSIFYTKDIHIVNLGSLQRSRMIPGPGQYTVKAGIDPVGNYFQSKHIGSGAPKFCHDGRKFLIISKLKRLAYFTIEEKTPGPGQYDPRGLTLNSPTGKSMISSFKNPVTNKFPTAIRPVSALSSHRYSLDTRNHGSPTSRK